MLNLISTSFQIVLLVYIFSHNRIDAALKLSYLISQHWVESVNATMEGDVHRTWGYKDKKTGWINGLSGQLQRKEADIGG